LSTERLCGSDFRPEAPYHVGMGDAVGHDDPALDAASCRVALADDLGWGLGTVFRAYVKAAHDAVADLPGGPRGFQVLSAAARGTVASQLALAQDLGVDRTVMTYLLDDLEAARLIQRVPDPADRRARRVVATKRGIALLASLDHRLRAAEDNVLAPLDAAARETFRSQVRLLATRINVLDPVDAPCSLAQQVDAELPRQRRRQAPQSASRAEH
jgi:DNA-binding MarR family transcriptional regulator